MTHRLPSPFLAPDGAAPAGGDDDGGFSVESASVAFAQAPDDTTAGAIAAQPEAKTSQPETTDVGNEPPAGTGEADETEVTDAGKADEGEVSASEATKPAKAEAKPPAKRGKPAKDRIDELTWNVRERDRQLEQERQRTADLERRLQALEKGQQPPKTEPQPEAKAEKKDDPRPKLPRYKDFATDEEYEAALAKHEVEDAAWVQRQLDARVESLRTDVTKGVDTRLSEADQAAAHRAAMHTMGSVLRKVSDTHADWDERAKALEPIQSSWYDPAKHGKAKTPFLSDLTQTMLMNGREEGAEILHWLGSDPERAQRVADLLPTRPLRDALVSAPSVTPLLEFFATEEGAQEFEALKRMHPISMMQAIGALSVRLSPAPRGSGATVHPVTAARPSARPQVGTPDARAVTERKGSGEKPTGDYLSWHLEEDAKEIQQLARTRGVTVTMDEALAEARKRLAG